MIRRKRLGRSCFVFLLFFFFASVVASCELSRKRLVPIGGKSNFFKESGTGALAILMTADDEEQAHLEYSYNVLKEPGLYSIKRSRLRPSLIVNHWMGARASSVGVTYLGIMVVKVWNVSPGHDVELYRDQDERWKAESAFSERYAEPPPEAERVFWEIHRDPKGQLQEFARNFPGDWHSETVSGVSSWGSRLQYWHSGERECLKRVIGDETLDEEYVTVQAFLLAFEPTESLDSERPLTWTTEWKNVRGAYIRTFSPADTGFIADYYIGIE